MSELGDVVALSVKVFGVVTVIGLVGTLLTMVGVFNTSISVALAGGDATPYIIALVMLTVSAMVPGWILAQAE